MELEYFYNGILWAIVRDANKAIDIGDWSICEDGRLERFYCKVQLVNIYFRSVFLFHA